MESAEKQVSNRTRWLPVLGAAAVLIAWFAVDGDRSRISWLFVALAVTSVSVATRMRDWKNLPPAERVAWREALIVLAVVSLIGFSIANFHRPDDWTEPYRLATTLSIPFAWMTFRNAQGHKQNYWLLLGGMLGVTIVWTVAGKLFIW
jgi:hypothetical protein